ncbi:MAG: asparagine synthase (glutamine-hydrolyzing) [Candidatus Entotheonellia bacterium]
MCGIAGIVTGPSRISDIAGRLRTARDVMAHRGPDGEGLYISPDGRVGLANRRLAIMDLSPAGHMPMANRDATLWITYNGEIYNAVDLRDELSQRGFVFRSTSDTEVVLHGYEAWGVEVLHRLNGMFAFAIYDQRAPLGASRVVLARDRLGIKPLYYAWVDGVFVFASELKAMRASGLIGKAINPAALVGYLMLGSIPAPLTIYENARCLGPGCVMTITVSAPLREPVVRRYWSPPIDTAPCMGVAETSKQIRGLLERVVQQHLISDAPLGAFLSGGLDSSAVVALMRVVGRGPIRTCSLVFEEAGYSETPYARAVATAVGAEHYEHVVTASEVRGELDNLFSRMDQPTIDGVNTYFVARTAREAGLTVALSGLGGDELFGGYRNTFHGIPWLMRAVWVTRTVPGLSALARRAAQVLSRTGRWTRLTDALERPSSASSAYLACRGLFPASQVMELVNPDLWEAATQIFDPLRSIEDRVGTSGQLFSWVSRAELLTYTHDQLLRDTDNMSMAHSLEVRVPLLDHRLVESVLRLPTWLKKNGAGPKGLLRKAVGDLLPQAVRERHEKQGFVLPFQQWLHGPLEGPPGGGDALVGLLTSNGLESLRRAWARGRLHWSRLWAIHVLQGWCRTHLETT